MTQDGTNKRYWSKLVCLLGLVALLGMVAPPVEAQNIATFMAVLNSAQVETPTGSPSFGNALVTLDLTTRELCYAISFSELEGAETVAHFHGPAAPGQSAGVQVGITPDISPVGSPKDGCAGPLTSEQIGQLARGQWYINVHSSVFGGGEIRGQVLFQGLVPAIP